MNFCRNMKEENRIRVSQGSTPPGDSVRMNPFHGSPCSLRPSQQRALPCPLRAPPTTLVRGCTSPRRCVPWLTSTSPSCSTPFTVMPGSDRASLLPCRHPERVYCTFCVNVALKSAQNGKNTTVSTNNRHSEQSDCQHGNDNHLEDHYTYLPT